MPCNQRCTVVIGRAHRRPCAKFIAGGRDRGEVVADRCRLPARAGAAAATRAGAPSPLGISRLIDLARRLIAPPPSACRSRIPSTRMSGSVRTIVLYCLIQPPWDDHVERAVLVFDQQERDAVRGLPGFWRAITNPPTFTWVCGARRRGRRSSGRRRAVSCSRSRRERVAVDRDAGRGVVGDHRLPIAERVRCGRVG